MLSILKDSLKPSTVAKFTTVVFPKSEPSEITSPISKEEAENVLFVKLSVGARYFEADTKVGKNKTTITEKINF